MRQFLQLKTKTQTARGKKKRTKKKKESEFNNLNKQKSVHRFELSYTQYDENTTEKL